jgi:hypothetical protein
MLSEIPKNCPVCHSDFTIIKNYLIWKNYVCVDCHIRVGVSSLNYFFIEKDVDNNNIYWYSDRDCCVRYNYRYIYLKQDLPFNITLKQLKIYLTFI